MTTAPASAVMRYSAGAMALHWLMAALIVASFVMAQFFDDVPKAWEAAYLNAHAVIGTLILLLLIARLAWRFTNRPPELPAQLGAVEKRGSLIVHSLMYILMFAVPAVGLLALFARGKGLDLGLFQIPSPIDRIRDLARSAKGIHELAAKALIILASLHFLAAMYHQFVRRDGVLARMLPAAK